MSEIRVPLTVTEPVAEGEPQVRVPLVLTEPVAEGDPGVRVALTFTEPVAEGGPEVRVPLIFVEVVQSVIEEGEMATELFPMGLGLAWETKKTPNFNTQVRTATSLRSTRNSLTPYPAWDFEVSFVYLPSDVPYRAEEHPDLQEVMGFFLEMHGRHGSFLHRDPQDHQVRGGAQGTGDGVTTEFYFRRTMRNFAEPVGQVDLEAGYTIYADGVAVDPANYTFFSPNQFIFDVAPAEGVVITADFDFLFVCNFLQDAADFQAFNRDLFQLQQVRFRADPA